MMKKYVIQGLLLSFLAVYFCSCSTAPPYRSENMFGAEELVMDSYKIQNGKYSILEMEGKPIEELNPEFLKEHQDVIENGDVLNISLYHPSREDLVASIASIGTRVGFKVENGVIELPDLKPIRVVGLTPAEAKKKLTKAYQSELSDSEIFISFKDRLEKRVELAGEVKTPSIAINGKTRLFDVLARAQIPTNANLFKSYVVRESSFVPVDLNKLVRSGDMTQNIVMQGGDKIYIADSAASNIMMLGEVVQRGLVSMTSGSMPLREALAKAGGIPFTGDRSYIQVIRGNILKPKIYTINWKHVINLPSNSLLLIPGDIVYVAATPITEWNRFISQLFPSFTAIDLFCRSFTGIIAIP